MPNISKIQTPDGTTYDIKDPNAISTETDPVFTGSVAHGISSSDIAAWNAAEPNVPITFGYGTASEADYPIMTIWEYTMDGIHGFLVHADDETMDGKFVFFPDGLGFNAGMQQVISMIPTVPTNVSSFTNDAGYLTLSTLPVYDGTVV